MCKLNPYLDVAEETSRPVTFVPLSGNELTANVFTLGAQGSSSVDVQTVTAGFQTVDDTTDLNRAVDRALFHHEFTTDVHAFDGDDGTTGTLNGPGGRPGGDASDSDNCNNNY